MKLNDVINAIGQGILICDREGRILHFNEAYGRFSGFELNQVRNRKIAQLREHSFVPKVLKTNKAVTNVYRRENGKEYFANIYPIQSEGEILGTVSIVTELGDYRLQIESGSGTLKEQTREFEREKIRSMLQIYGDSVEAKKQIARILGISLSGLYAKLEEK